MITENNIFSELLEKNLKISEKFQQNFGGPIFLWSHKIAQTLGHVLGMNLLDQYFCPKNSPIHKIEEF